MLRCLRWALILAFSSGALLSRASAQPFDFTQAAWETIEERRGIQTFRWRPPGHDLFAFKGIGVIDAPIAKIATLFEDWRRLTEWVPDLEEVRVLRHRSALERVQYMLFATPFIIKDRDFVINSRAHFDPETYVIRIEFHSILDPAAPETQNVRGRIVAGEYLLEPRDDLAKTRLTMQVYLDPRGSVPRWIVNRTQRSFPRKTISALRERCSREGVRDHPLARAVLDGEISSEAEAMEFPIEF